jgi:hypothetical protein
MSAEQKRAEAMERNERLEALLRKCANWLSAIGIPADEVTDGLLSEIRAELGDGS